MSDIETKDFELKLLGEHVEQTNSAGQPIGIITGLASTFNNVDRVGDVCVRGCFREAKAGLPMLWQHLSHSPIGRIRELKETDAGLEFEAELILAVPQARDAWELARGSVITATSIGYRVQDHDFAKHVDPVSKKERRIRRLKKLSLHEISMVTSPANDLAILTSVKSTDLLDIEDDNGALAALNSGLKRLTITDQIESIKRDVAEMRQMRRLR